MQSSSVDLDSQIAALPARMSHVIRPWAQRSPDAAALSEGVRVLTYRELAQAIQTAGQWLAQQGVRPGDRVMLLGENSIALAVLVLAIGDIDAYPPEVEAVLAAHPAVASCAVVGRSVPGNEEVVAFVQLKPGATATAEEIGQFAAQHLAPYKRPIEVFIKASLPATSAGKIPFFSGDMANSRPKYFNNGEGQ
ncbi:hypothetical protein GCM10010975_32210 [Comamonas phosphati]|nr:hypothetical protein GCM10010975_32210 [Comamonas phosphati]